jgi:hypothetical protein
MENYAVQAIVSHFMLKTLKEILNEVENEKKDAKKFQMLLTATKMMNKTISYLLMKVYHK